MGKVLFKGDTADAPEAGGLTRHRPASPQGRSRGAGHRRTASVWGAGDVTECQADVFHTVKGETNKKQVIRQ